MERSWIWRRWMVYLIVVSCLGMLFAALVIGGNDLVTQAIVQGCFMTLIAVAGAYLGIAEWSDRNKAKEQLAGIVAPEKPESEVTS